MHRKGVLGVAPVKKDIIHCFVPLPCLEVRHNLKTLFHVYRCFVCLYIWVPFMCPYLRKPEQGIRSPGTEVIDVCEMNPRPLEKQPGL